MDKSLWQSIGIVGSALVVFIAVLTMMDMANDRADKEFRKHMLDDMIALDKRLDRIEDLIFKRATEGLSR